MSEKMPVKYVAEGVKFDMKHLLTKFVKMESASFSVFATLWKEGKYSLIFSGKDSLKEQPEFIQESYRIILEFFHPKADILIKTGCLYLLYSFYRKHPLQSKVKIRLTYEKVMVLKELIEEAEINGQHPDVIYIYRYLQISGAFDYVATAMKTGPRANLWKIVKKLELVSFENSCCQTILESNLLQELSDHHKQYEEIKENMEVDLLGLNVATNCAEDLLSELNFMLPKQERPEDFGEMSDDLNDSDSEQKDATYTDEISRQATLKQQQYKSTPMTKFESRVKSLIGN